MIMVVAAGGISQSICLVFFSYIFLYVFVPSDSNLNQHRLNACYFDARNPILSPKWGASEWTPCYVGVFRRCFFDWLWGMGWLERTTDYTGRSRIWMLNFGNGMFKTHRNVWIELGQHEMFCWFVIACFFYTQNETDGTFMLNDAGVEAWCTTTWWWKDHSFHSSQKGGRDHRRGVGGRTTIRYPPANWEPNPIGCKKLGIDERYVSLPNFLEL